MRQQRSSGSHGRPRGGVRQPARCCWLASTDVGRRTACRAAAAWMGARPPAADALPRLPPLHPSQYKTGIWRRKSGARLTGSGPQVLQSVTDLNWDDFGRKGLYGNLVPKKTVASVSAWGLHTAPRHHSLLPLPPLHAECPPSHALPLQGKLWRLRCELKDKFPFVRDPPLQASCRRRRRRMPPPACPAPLSPAAPPAFLPRSI